MLSFHQLIFLSFVVCCSCKNELGYAGSYSHFDHDDPVYYSAFTSTLDEALKYVHGHDEALNACIDFAMLHAFDIDNVLASKDGNDFVIMFTPFEGNNGFVEMTVDNDNANTFLIDGQPVVFYPYKGDVRKEFTLKSNKNVETYKSNGEKVTEQELKVFINYKDIIPPFAKYTEFFKVTFGEESNQRTQMIKLGILTNKEEGVIDVVELNEEGKVVYKACIWKDTDEIHCDKIQITFEGEVIGNLSDNDENGGQEGDGSLVSVVSCLVFFISVFVFSFL